MSESQNFTCNTCGLSFASADGQREHMKSDWHRYNLKRRVAGLPPVSSEVFAEKMVEQRSALLEPKTRGSGNRQVTKKDLKRMEKQKKREEMLANSTDGETASHAGSRADSMTSAMSSFSLGDPVRSAYQTGDESELSDDEGNGGAAARAEGQADGQTDDVDRILKKKLETMVEIPANVSFMDGHESKDVEENVEYLERKFGLVIPEREYVSDLTGLVLYLNEKVGLGNCCLSCHYMGRSLEAARAHMVSKQHCKIPYDTQDQKMELADYYDFSSSYAPSSGDWEDVSDDGVEGDEKITVDGDYDDEDLDESNLHVAPGGYELVLGSGRTAGHRSLQRYYRQRYVGLPEKEGRKAVRLIDLRSPGVTEKSANKLVKSAWKEEKKAQYTQFKRDKFINHQAHYRDQLLQ